MKIKCIFHFYLFFLFPNSMLAAFLVLLGAAFCEEMLKAGSHAAKQIFNIAISLAYINSYGWNHGALLILCQVQYDFLS